MTLGDLRADPHNNTQIAAQCANAPNEFELKEGGCRITEMVGAIEEWAQQPRDKPEHRWELTPSQATPSVCSSCQLVSKPLSPVTKIIVKHYSFHMVALTGKAHTVTQKRASRVPSVKVSRAEPRSS